MLVATQFDSIDSIERDIKKYVDTKLNKKNIQIDSGLYDYSLEDSRLELSSSVKHYVSNRSELLLYPNEKEIGGMLISPIQMDILDMIPIELRNEFRYENEVTDAKRTSLLQRDLTIVTLIQNVQDTLNSDDVANEENSLFFDNEVITDEKNSVFSSDETTNTITENNIIDSFDENDIGSDSVNTETDLDTFTLEDADEFVLDNNESLDDFSLDTEEVEDNTDEFVLDNNEPLDDFSLDIEENNTDEFVLDNNESLDNNEPLDDFSLDTEEEVETKEDVEELIDENLEDLSELETDLKDETLETKLVQTEDLLDNKEVEGKEDLFGISKEDMGLKSKVNADRFKSIMLDGNVKEERQSSYKKPIKQVESDEDVLLEDLDTVEEDTVLTDALDIEDTDELAFEDNEDTDELAFEDSEEQDDLEFENSEEQDDLEFENSEEQDDLEFGNSEEKDELEVESSEDINEVTFDANEENDDLEFEDSDSEESESYQSVTSFDEVQDVEDDNVEFKEKVVLTNPNKVKPTGLKTDLGNLFQEKIVQQEQRDLTKVSNFVADTSTEKKEVDVGAIKEHLTTDTRPVARAPAEPVQQKQVELEPLRVYLKKNPYSRIEDLLKIGYTRNEIDDGVKRGRILRKNGMLRALF